MPVLKLKILLPLMLLALVSATVMIPASALVAPKAVMCLAVFILTSAALLFNGRLSDLSLPISIAVLLFSVIIIGLTFHTIVENKADYLSALGAMARYLTLVGVVYCSFLLMEWRWLSPAAALRTLLLGHLIYLLAKVAFMLVVKFANLPADAVMDIASRIAPSATVHGFQVNEGIVRIFLGNDAITPYLMGIYLLAIHSELLRRSVWTDLYFIAGLVVIALCFTRYIWLVSAVTLAAYAALYVRGLKDLELKRCLWVIVSSSAIVFWIITPNVDQTIINQTISERMGDTLSHSEKLIQIELSLKSFLESPLTGTGIGSSIEGHASPATLKFQYEAQWFVLLMQLGLIGFLALLIIASSPLWPWTNLGKASFVSKDFWFLACLYGMWLLGAATNPYLFILSSIAVYIGVLIVSVHCAKKAT